jgi:hypothetical protein
MNWVFDISISMVVYLGALCIISPRVLVPGLLVAATGYAVGQIYVRAMLGIKRELSVRKAPVLAVFSSAISGLGGLLTSSRDVHVLIVSTQLIQETLRTQIGKDVLVLIVAHRLKTIIDTDKIVRVKSHVSLITDDRRWFVLDSGRLVEVGTPHGLLAKEGSLRVRIETYYTS